ncbi:hypothetical protein [Pedobacter planticolens]|nr:hypothetical protein [Pedobacter planticolens]
MILTHRQFREQITEISNILLEEGRTNLVLRKHRKDKIIADKEYYKNWYDGCFIDFPLHTIARYDEIFTSDSFILNYKMHFFLAQQVRDSKEKDEILNFVEAYDEESARCDLDDFIDERLMNFIHYFKEAISLLKKGSYFSHIKDTNVIIRNLLSYYQQVKLDEGIQISFFPGVKLPFKISSIMLDILIAILTDKLQMLEQEYVVDKPAIVNLVPEEFKINWLGSQKDFAELLVELETRNFISYPDGESYASKARRLAGIFDFSASQRNSGSNISGNLTTNLKPTYNVDNGRNEYFFEKEKYKRKFDKIPINLTFKKV